MSIRPVEQRQFIDTLRRGAFVLICLAALVCTCAAQTRKPDANKQDAGALYLVRQCDLWGYIDRTGQVIIKRQFGVARDLAEGLAVALIGRQYGFIDKRGQWIVQPRFEKVSSFAEGLALVVVNNRHGFIDRTGAFVVQPQYNNAYNFSEGLANVAIGGRYGCIDKQGAFVIPL